jgi:acetyl-CoA carboxylase carboxyl transferase subunit beta
MAIFDKLKAPGIKEKTTAEKVHRVPEGMWTKCPSCGEVMQTKILRENHLVCVACNYHFRMTARERINLITSGAEFKEYGQDLRSNDPLEFSDLKKYSSRLKDSIAKFGVNDAFLSGASKVGAIPVQIGSFEFKFMGGSMGCVVGERVTLLFEHALKDETPVIVVSASGGARMQESILSLMQMAKTSAYILQMREAGLPYISILTDPTTGGVAASFAMLGDIIIAEPNALIGFAGPRVIEQTIRQKLPEGFQRSEFLLEHGFVDKVVHRGELAPTLESLLSMILFKRLKKKSPGRGIKARKVSKG